MKNKALPDFFKPLLWSYNFNEIDSEKDKKVIIVNAINYGDLKHWRWIKKRYDVAGVLSLIPASELRDRARALAAIIFKIKDFNYAFRGSR